MGNKSFKRIHPFRIMVALWIILIVDFLTGANFGSSISNLSSQIIKFYGWVVDGKNDEPTLDKNDLVTSLLSVAVLIGSMAGSMSVTYFMNKYGPKKVAIAASIAGAVLNGLTMIPVHWAFLFTIRILVGIPSAALTTVVPGWLSTLASDSSRGILVVLYQLFICFGIILSSLILLALGENYGLWWISFLVTTIFCSLSAVGCFFLPDRKQQSNAEEGKAEEIQSELPWKELFTKKFSKVIINMFLLGVAQQGTGINSVIIYATLTFSKVFKSDNDWMSPVLGSLLISGVNFLSTCVALPFINKLGRRFLWFTGTLFCAIGHILFIICYAIAEKQDSPNMAFLITGSIIFLFGFEIGPGPCFFVLTSETFPACVRAKCAGVAFTMNWVVNIIVVLIFPFFKDFVYVAYIIYFIMMIVPTVILWFTIPETKGKSLEQVSAELIGEVDTNNEAALLNNAEE